MTSAGVDEVMKDPQNEYEVQAHGFSPNALTDTVYNAVSQAVRSAIETEILSRLQGAADSDFKKRVHQELLRKFETGLSGRMARVLEETSKVLAVPVNVVLDSDAVHDTKEVDEEEGVNEDIGAALKELEKLRYEYEQLTEANAEMKKCNDLIENVLAATK